LGLTGGGAVQRVSVPSIAEEPVDVNWNGVGPAWFGMLGTNLLRGREFAERDPSTAAIVNEAFARRFWGSPDAAMGRLFRVQDRETQVIGVAENGKYGTVFEDPKPYLYLPAPAITQGEGNLIVETRIDAPSAIAALRKALAQAAPEVTLVSIVSMREHMRTALFGPRMGAAGVGALALLGVFLAGVGLYGLMAYSVSRRAREIGIRMALGARSAAVVRLVLGRTLLLVVVGSSIGLALALTAAHVVSSLLYRVSPADPIGLAVAVFAVAAVALAAAHVPARRALRVDPMSVLREE
ncbi:MAG TPA: FtsX-like permease family protein, partial [Candidatus Sulfopaludibacter sp.]|nr:FtsX-like permease family protein [Candidatus Sulfopaludibacter sp.]